jgi:D-glycero-beta-D-manno-heptose-7-phosphate kinase
MNLPTLSTLSQTHVMVVGDLMLDRYWYGQVDRISPEAPVPVVHVQREEDRLGGCGNVGYNLVNLGVQASLLSVVGQDAAGDRLRQLLAESGIAVELRQDPGLSTTMKLRIIGRNQQLLRADFENLPDHEVLAALLQRYAQLLPSHQAVLFSDYGKGGLAHVADMIDQAKACHLPVLIDPKGSDYSRYQGATVITPNRAELREVIGPWRNEAHLEEMAQNLRQQLGLHSLLLTRSEEGMSLYDDAGVTHVAAQAREVFDVTGAGDTVIATLAALLGAGLSLREALPWANKAGGIVVGKFGTAAVSWNELTA